MAMYSSFMVTMRLSFGFAVHECCETLFRDVPSALADLDGGKHSGPAHRARVLNTHARYLSDVRGREQVGVFCKHLDQSELAGDAACVFECDATSYFSFFISEMSSQG